MSQELLIVLSLVFLVAGMVKGVVGMGMPTIALASLAIFRDVPFAMAMIVIPTLVTNLVQGFTGRYLRSIISKIWIFLLCVAICIWPGLKLAFLINPGHLSMFLGVMLVGVSTAELANLSPDIKNPENKGKAAGLGILNGLITGMTGTFIFPSVLYFRALGFTKEVLVQAMGITFSIFTLSVAIGLRRHELLTNDLLVLSAMAILPAVAGMKLGQSIRGRLKEVTFRFVFNLSLFALGTSIFIKGLLQII